MLQVRPSLVQQDKQLGHERILDSFQRFSNTIEKYQGKVLELRGDALVAKFDRASDAVSAAHGNPRQPAQGSGERQLG